MARRKLPGDLTASVFREVRAFHDLAVQLVYNLNALPRLVQRQAREQELILRAQFDPSRVEMPPGFKRLAEGKSLVAELIEAVRERAPANQATARKKPGRKRGPKPKANYADVRRFCGPEPSLAKKAGARKKFEISRTTLARILNSE